MDDVSLLGENPGGVDSRKFVVALARGLALLRAFRPGEHLLGNSEFAERTGLPKSTVTRLTYTLETLGYLRFDALSNRYAPDVGVLALANSLVAGRDLIHAARPHLLELAQTVGAAVSIGCREALQVMYLETVRSETALTLGLAAGSRLSMLTSSMGRAYLAALSEAERENLYGQLASAAVHNALLPGDLSAPSQVGITQAVKAARTAVARFAKVGYCVSFGDWHRDVNALAVPFYDRWSERWLILSCSGPATSMAPDIFHRQIAPRLIGLAERLGNLAASNVVQSKAGIDWKPGPGISFGIGLEEGASGRLEP